MSRPWAIEAEHLVNGRTKGFAYETMIPAGPTEARFCDVLKVGTTQVRVSRLRGWRPVTIAQVSTGIGKPGSIELDDAKHAAEVLETLLNRDFAAEWGARAMKGHDGPGQVGPVRMYVMVFAPEERVEAAALSADVIHRHFWYETVQEAVVDLIGITGAP